MLPALTLWAKLAYRVYHASPALPVTQITRIQTLVYPPHALHLVDGKAFGHVLDETFAGGWVFQLDCILQCLRVLDCCGEWYFKFRRGRKWLFRPTFALCLGFTQSCAFYDRITEFVVDSPTTLLIRTE